MCIQNIQIKTIFLFVCRPQYDLGISHWKCVIYIVYSISIARKPSQKLNSELTGNSAFSN